LPNNVNFFIWLGKSHSPRLIVGRSHHAAHSRRAALSRRAAPSHHALHWPAIHAIPSRWTPSFLTAAAKGVSRMAAPSRRQLRLVRQLSLEGISESASQGIITSGTVLSKTVIFPKNEGRKCEKKFRYRTSPELENSVLEINHVTNVTKVLNETTASDRVSRSSHKINIGKCLFLVDTCDFFLASI